MMQTKTIIKSLTATIVELQCTVSAEMVTRHHQNWLTI
jgi:hypothetical protein